MTRDNLPEQEPLQVLTHEPWPGFRPAFYGLFALCGAWLAYILVTTLGAP